MGDELKVKCKMLIPCTMQYQLFVQVWKFDDETVLFYFGDFSGPTADSADGLDFSTKVKAFWEIKYPNIYPTNK